MLSRYISPQEDTLTASVFGHLLHLPVETFWQILRQACDGHELPEHCGEPLLIDPWPKWASEGTSNSRYVEPDLFLRFAEFDLIIEAKRWDGGMQSHDQWAKQLISYHNVYGANAGEENQNCHYLAVGGLWSYRSERFSFQTEDGSVAGECVVSKARWQGIVIQCQRLLRHLQDSPYPTSQDRANQRLLGDLIELFAVHGFSTGRWFEDLDFTKNRPAHRAETSAIFGQLLYTYS
ncbi:hypothetical protein OAL23_00775 [bacterium]|nr:hypothetical protein [bacterium]